MKDANELIKVKVSFPAWGVSDKSWYLLTERNSNGKVWSGGEWFPKSKCSLVDSEESGAGVLTLPSWLFEYKTREGIKFTTLDNEII